MSDPSSEHDDLRALWQGQPQEFDPMSVQHIQAISRRLDRNEQRTVLIMLVVGALAFFGAGVGWQMTHDLMIRATFVLYGLGVVGCFAIFHLMLQVRRDPTEPGGVFLRRRLEQYLRLASGRNMLGLLPFLPWLVSLVVVGFLKHEHAPPPPHLTAAQLALNLLPIIVLAAAWAVTLMVWQPRQVRRLRRDLEELNAAMK